MIEQYGTILSLSYGPFTPTTPTRRDSTQLLSRIGVVGVNGELAITCNFEILDQYIT